MKSFVYLDHNATTPLRPAAFAAATAALQTLGNPSSVHRHGRAVRRLIDRARSQVANLVGADPANVVFTSGGTEANALALRGSGRPRVIVSAVEHACVRQAVPDPEVVPVDRQGVLDLAALDVLLGQDTSRPAIVSVMLANNETGVVQPLADVVAIARRHGALVHSDAVQAAGRMPLRIDDLGIDLLSLSAHKIGGPLGIGAVIGRDALALTAESTGGGQERGLRAGTENVPGIAGFGAAAEAAAGLEDVDRLRRLRDRLEACLRGMAPDCCIVGQEVDRLPNTTCVIMPGVPAETQVIAFDLAGISVSAGAACSSGTVTISPVLRAMGLGIELASCAVRISLGWTSNDDDIERCCTVWQELYHRARLGRVASAEPVLAASQ